MADPLSTAASILTVIQLTDQVLTHCYAYIGMVKNAAAEIDNVIHVIGLLKGIFFNLHQLAIANPSSARLNDLIAAGGPLSVCSGVLKQLEAKLNTPSAKLTATRKLLWPFESKKLEGLLEKIRQQKPALLLSLATDNANFSYKIRDDVRQIQAGLDSARLEDKRERVLGWLRPSDSKEKHLTSRRLQEHGTNQWVLDNVKFQRWTQEPRQNIWVILRQIESLGCLALRHPQN
jgi:hypothetical protein